jgi:hypothetical protein
MKMIIIKRASYPHEGSDTKVFRAYGPALQAGRRDDPLGVSASTTGAENWGVQRCAAKAFKKYTEPEADLDEIETRIRLKNIGSGIWTATLDRKGQP